MADYDDLEPLPSVLPSATVFKLVAQLIRRQPVDHVIALRALMQLVRFGIGQVTTPPVEPVTIHFKLAKTLSAHVDADLEAVANMLEPAVAFQTAPGSPHNCNVPWNIVLPVLLPVLERLLSRWLS